MPPIALLFLLLLAASEAPVNLDFESGVPGEVPPGWIAPTAALGYPVVLSTETPTQGRQCVRVSGRPASANAFGNVMQVIDATRYRGKRVRMRGAVRVEGAAGNAGLWMRVDRASRVMGFFDNMQDRPIRSAEWRYYEITGDVAGDAVTLNVGMLLRGEGTAWLDDVTLEIIAKPPERSAPARALTPRGLENLIAFTRLYGIVRHFHPSDEAAAADWDAVAVNGAEHVEGAKDAAELATRLGDVFLPLAPTLRFDGVARASGASATAIVAWEHHGFGPKDGQFYRSERIRRPVDQAPEPFRMSLGGGVTASIPLAVFADATRTLPAATRAPLPVSPATYSGNDRGTRIGAVVILWNVIQHFYPYFDVVDVDWPAELRTALRAAASDRDEAAFHRTLLRMMAAIDDGHGRVTHESTTTLTTLPLRWRAIGDALVITAVDPSASGVSIGDEVTAIDGKPVLRALAEAEALISGATPQWRRWRALYELTTGTAPAALTIGTRVVTLPRTIAKEPPREKRPEKIAELKPGLWYVDLERITDGDFNASLEKLAAARGIVFDLRGYPRVGIEPLRHLIDGPTQSARWNTPIIRRPNREGWEWDTNGRWELTPLPPRLPKNIVFLTDARAISYAESWMGIVEAYRLGTIVGETTAGTNGNINIVELPGGYRTVFTGMKVLKHDGSRHHGAGIAPNVPVTPTLKGIRAGRDEQLEKAVEVLERVTKASLNRQELSASGF
ncbi:MAG TPA: S41 family peptidase [Thermoanaerobaculia bacterium]|nr:S41 family peptidase [Thermoanaerobaculia bacterium]